MRTTSHACAIDAYSTAVAGIAYDTSDGYRITSCRTVRAGLDDYTGPNSARALRKLASLLKKQGIEHLALSVHPPCFFPMVSVFPDIITSEAFETYCRAEACNLLDKPGDYLHDHIPYALRSGDDRLRRQLLIYYPGDLLEKIYRHLRSLCSIRMGSHYLRPMIMSMAATNRPFTLLEIEPEYLTCSVGSNGELDYFRFWQLNHSSDAEYFALREVTANPEYQHYPVFFTGALSADRSLMEKISDAAQKDIQPLNLVKLLSMQCDLRSSCSSPVELKALCAALMSLHDRSTS